MTDQDDVALIEACRRGEQSAWRALVQRYQRLVYAIVRRAGLDEHAAADVFQTVFSRLLQHLPRLSQPERLQAWIVTTAKREALLQRSRGMRTVSMTSSAGDEDEAPEWDVPDQSPLPEEALAELQQLDQVRQAMARMEPRCRDLLGALFGSDGEPPAYEDVARRLGIPVGSIGPTRARCLARLRTMLE